MGKYKRYKNSLEMFMAGDKGKRLFNYAYSWGAAVVILGTLFKLLHLPGSNIMLVIGMGVEVFIFTLSAFDEPGKEYNWEDVFPVLGSKNPEDRPDFNTAQISDQAGIIPGVTVNMSNFPNQSSSDNNGAQINYSTDKVNQDSGDPVNSQTGQAPMVAPINYKQVISLSEEDSSQVSESIKKLGSVADQLSQMTELANATSQYLERLSSMSANIEQFNQTTVALNSVSNQILVSYQSINDSTGNIGSFSQGYVSQMETLNKNLTGINTIYEIQLRSISSQLETIQKVNSGLNNIRNMYDNSFTDSAKIRMETEKMTEHLASLNTVYERMLSAMTINMFNRPNAG